jgi:hypothetical protein
MEVSVDPADFIPLLRHYFLEELKQSGVFLALAAAAVVAGCWLWKTQSAFRHALWPLLAVAAIQLAIGSLGLVRIPAKSVDAQARLLADTPGFKSTETLRLTGVLDALRFYKLAEIAMILAAIGLALFLPHNTTARGWALGLLLQAALMLAAGLVAEQRTEGYLDALRRL